MKKSVLFILLGVIALGSCKKVVEVKNLDKEINLYFTYDYTGSFLTTFDNDYTTSMVEDFDKRDYKYIDSITFNIALITERTNDTAFVRLYNITDHVEIANSLIVAPSIPNPTRYVEFHSKNILADLPDKRIDLGIQIRGSSPGRAASGANPHLKLRRN